MESPKKTIIPSVSYCLCSRARPSVYEQDVLISGSDFISLLLKTLHTACIAPAWIRSACALPVRLHSDFMCVSFSSSPRTHVASDVCSRIPPLHLGFFVCRMCVSQIPRLIECQVQCRHIELSSPRCECVTISALQNLNVKSVSPV